MIVPILALRVFESAREIITVNGTKTVRHGALVFQTEVSGTNAVNLSAKQLDNLAGLAGVNRTGKEGWLAFKSLVGLGRSRAQVTVEEYKEGDEFLNADKTVGKHTKDGVSISVDAIMLADATVKAMDEKTIEVVNDWNKFVIPSVQSIAEVEQLGVN